MESQKIEQKNVNFFGSADTKRNADHNERQRDTLSVECKQFSQCDLASLKILGRTCECMNIQEESQLGREQTA